MGRGRGRANIAEEKTQKESSQTKVDAKFCYDLLSAFRDEAELYKSDRYVINRMVEMGIESLEPKLFEQLELIAVELKKNRNI